MQDTQIASHHSLHNFKHNAEYDSWWSMRSQDNQNTGVGILIQKQFSKYVQKVYKISTRIIFIDLFFPGQKKLRFFSLYAPQRTKQQRLERINFFNKVIQHINNAKNQNMHVILSGDFNASPDNLIIYLQRKSSSLPHHLQLIYYLYQNNFLDIHPTVDNKKFPTFIDRGSSRKSRID